MATSAFANARIASFIGFFDHFLDNERSVVGENFPPQVRAQLFAVFLPDDLIQGVTAHGTL